MENQFYDFDADQERIKNIKVNEWTNKKVLPPHEREYHRQTFDLTFADKGFFYENGNKHHIDSDVNREMEANEVEDQYYAMLRGYDRYRDAYTAPETGVIGGPRVPALSHHQYGKSDRPFWAPPPRVASGMNDWNSFSPSTERYEADLQSIYRPSTLAAADRRFPDPNTPLNPRREGPLLPRDRLNPPQQPFLRFGDNAFANYDRQPLTQPHPEYGLGFANPEVRIGRDSRGEHQAFPIQGTVQDKYPHTERETQFIWPEGPDSKINRFEHGFRRAYGYDNRFDKYYPSVFFYRDLNRDLNPDQDQDEDLELELQLGLGKHNKCDFF